MFIVLCLKVCVVGLYCKKGVLVECFLFGFVIWWNYLVGIVVFLIDIGCVILLSIFFG